MHVKSPYEFIVECRVDNLYQLEDQIQQCHHVMQNAKHITA